MLFRSEVLDKMPNTTNGVGKATKGLYPLANLLKDVEKSYDPGKKLLDESPETDIPNSRTENQDNQTLLSITPDKAEQSSPYDEEAPIHFRVEDEPEIPQTGHDQRLSDKRSPPLTKPRKATSTHFSFTLPYYTI